MTIKYDIMNFEMAVLKNVKIWTCLVVAGSPNLQLVHVGKFNRRKSVYLILNRILIYQLGLTNTSDK